jgi:hypothetical protein
LLCEGCLVLLLGRTKWDIEAGDKIRARDLTRKYQEKSRIIQLRLALTWNCPGKKSNYCSVFGVHLVSHRIQQHPSASVSRLPYFRAALFRAAHDVNV